jgi:hypothetical protein
MATQNPYAAFTDAELEALANQRVDAALAPEKQAIAAAQQAAAARALADRRSIQGFGTAAAGLMQGIAPGIQAGYDVAARALSDIAGGFSAGEAARVRAAQQTNQDFVNRQAPGSAPGKGPDVSALQDVSFGLGGYIPSGALETQGAAARAYAEKLPAIELRSTQEADLARMAQAGTEDAGYRQQLIALAAKRPDLRAQILDELHAQEIAKLNARIAQKDLTLRQKAQALAEKQAKQNEALRERAQALYERQFGETQKQNAARNQIEYAGLALRSARDKAYLQAQAAKGNRPDATLSKAYGYIVDGNGNPILRNGKRIPVAKTSSSQGARSAYGQAVRAARSNTVYGTPVRAKQRQDYPGHYVQPRGLYVARQGAQGVFPDGTTNNPDKAQHSGGMNFAEAQRYLMATYGLSRAQARTALIAAGWKPDGNRPRATGGYDNKKRG